jgi:hypothetical protein
MKRKIQIDLFIDNLCTDLDFPIKIKKKHHIFCFKRSFCWHWDSASLRLVKELAVLIVNTQKKFFGVLA